MSWQEHFGFEISLCGKRPENAPVCSQVCLTNYISSTKMPSRLLLRRRAAQAKFQHTSGQLYTLGNAPDSLLKITGGSLHLFLKISPLQDREWWAFVSKELVWFKRVVNERRYGTICSLAPLCQACFHIQRMYFKSNDWDCKELV